MDKTAKRVIAYGMATVVGGAMIYLGYVKDYDADPMTLLGAANVQLALARSFPKEDAAGRPNEARVTIVEQAREQVRRARAQDPLLHAGIELEAHLSWMDGDYAKAAALFQEAASAKGATPESGVLDKMNQARMLRAAGQAEQALAVTETLSEFLGEHAESALMQRIGALRDLKRVEEAVPLARRLVCFSGDPRVLSECGDLLESQNETDAAVTAYRRAAGLNPIANYYLARLKIRNRDFDSALELLTKAMQADRGRTQSLLSKDEAEWNPVRKNERFEAIVNATENAAPGR